jgi:formylglycine-generating enzyme required for sulfatase activity
MQTSPLRAFRRLFLLLPFASLAGPAALAQEPAPIRDCADCPPMVMLPAGVFTMGASRREEELEGVPEALRGRSVPPTRVGIAPGLAMARHTVTRGEYAAFVQATGRQNTPGCFTFVNSGLSYEYLEQPELDWRNPGFAQTDAHPVVCVSWEDATAYAAWISERAGHAYRLPSEAEWEYAARAGTTTGRWWGDARSTACGFANVADLTLATALNLDRRPQFTFRCNDGHVFTAPVGSFRANPFGLQDMLGNVWQWTADCLNPNLAGQLSDGAARTDGNCGDRMMRGGSWSHLPWYVRAGNRVRGRISERFAFVGFRLVRER